ncbi:hypothetical protein TNCV_1126141 [Trichonephila clavipes]|nr:hypothetical protein TNCV_1126141 [Trichonephila clavipes]
MSTKQVTVRFASIPPQFSGRTTLRGVRGLSPLFPIHQRHERTCGSTAILNSPMPRRRYTFTNSFAFSGIRTQPQRHSTAVSVT